MTTAQIGLSIYFAIAGIAYLVIAIGSYWAGGPDAPEEMLLAWKNPPLVNVLINLVNPFVWIAAIMWLPLAVIVGDGILKEVRDNRKEKKEVHL